MTLPTPAPLTGKFVWLWNVRQCDGGDTAAIARRCHDHGITGVLVKSDDGGTVFDQGRPWNEIAFELRDAGLHVLAWGYHYLDNWEDEAERVISLAQCGACDGYVSDLEAETEGKGEQCTAYYAHIRSAIGWHFPLGYSPLPVIDFHQSLPYVQANAACQWVMPQFYTRALLWPLVDLWEQWDRWGQTWRAMGLHVPAILPVFDAYLPGNAEDMPAYAQSAWAHAAFAASFWSYEHMLPEIWEAVKAFDLEHYWQGEAMLPAPFDRWRTWEDAANSLHGIVQEANRWRKLDREDAEATLVTLSLPRLTAKRKTTMRTTLSRIIDRNSDTV